MNVGTLKTLSYLTSFGLLGGIGYIGYDYYARGQHVRYFDSKRAGDVLKGVEAPKPPVPLALNYKDDIEPAIVNFDWTGAPPPPPPPPPGPKEPEGPPPLVPVSDILDVVGIISHDTNPGLSKCLLRLKGAAAGEGDMFLFVGDALPQPHDNVAVFDIRPDAVVFSFADEEREKEEVIPRAREDVGVIVHVSDPESVIAPRGLNGVVPAAAIGPEAPTQTVKRNGQYFLGTEDSDMFAQNYDQILSRDVTTETYYDKDGKRAGIQLTSVKEGSIAARHGAQQGDIIISINGTPVSSKQEAISFAKKNSELYNVWRVEVMNLGRVRTEVYHSSND